MSQWAYEEASMDRLCVRFSGLGACYRGAHRVFLWGIPHWHSFCACREYYWSGAVAACLATPRNSPRVPPSPMRNASNATDKKTPAPPLLTPSTRSTGRTGCTSYFGLVMRGAFPEPSQPSADALAFPTVAETLIGLSPAATPLAVYTAREYSFIRPLSVSWPC